MASFGKKYNKVIIYSIVLSIAINLLCHWFSSRELIYDTKNFVIIFFLSMLGLFLAGKFYKIGKALCIMSVYMVLALIIPYIAYLTEPLYLTRLMKDFLVVYTIGIVMLITPLAFVKFNDKIVCFINGCLSCLVLLPTLIVAGYCYVANAKLSSDTIVAVLQTDKQEAIEFLNSYLSFPDYVIFVGLIIGSFLLGYYFTGWLFTDMKKQPFNSLPFACLCCVLIVSDVLFLQKTYLFRSYQFAKSSIRALENFKDYESKRIALFSANGVVSSKWGG